MNPTYDTIMKIDTFDSLPMNVQEGSIAYCRDTKRHYMFDMATWTPVSDRTQAQIDAAVATKANTVHTHVVSDVTGLDSFLSDKAGKDDYTFYKLGSVVKPIKEYSNDTAVLSTLGKFRFYLTSNGLSTGSPVFSSSVIIGTANLVILDTLGGSYRETSYTLSADKKYIDVAVKKQTTPLASLLGINVALDPVWADVPAGVSGYLSIKGV